MGRRKACNKKRGRGIKNRDKVSDKVEEKTPTQISSQKKEMEGENSSDMEKSILTKLSPEVKLLLIEKLSVYDKMSLSETSKEYNELFQLTTKFHEDKAVVIGPHNYAYFYTTFNNGNDKIQQTMLPNIEFRECKEGLDNIVRNDIFWNKYGLRVLSLMFISCGPCKDDILQYIFSYCPNLQDIRLVDCTKTDDWVKALNKFSKLKNLQIRRIHSSVFSDFAFNHLVTNASRLHHVETKVPMISQDNDEIPNKRMKFDPDFYKSIPLRNLSKTQLTYKNVIHVLPLSNISTWRRKLNYTEMLDICNLHSKGLRLKEVQMDHHVWESPDLAFKIFKLITNNYAERLIYLDISGCMGPLYATNNHFTGFSKLINLRTLVLPNRVSPQNLQEISRLSTLENLSFSGGIGNLYCFGKLRNLRRLSIAGSLIYNVDLFMEVLSDKLIELDFNTCAISRSDRFFDSLRSTHQCLEKLSLRNCVPIVKDKDVCSRHTRTTRSTTAKLYRRGISSLQCLKSLTIIDSDITDESIIEEFKWNGLLKLDLQENDHITDESMLLIPVNCPGLTELNLTGCQYITDEGVQHLCHLKRLRKLNLTDTRVTQVGIDFLLNSNCPISFIDWDEGRAFKTKN